MRKSCFAFGVGLVMAGLAGCASSNYVKEGIGSRVFDPSLNWECKEDLEKLIHYDYLPGEEMTKNNNQSLVDNTPCEEAEKIIRDIEGYKDSIYEKLLKVEPNRFQGEGYEQLLNVKHSSPYDLFSMFPEQVLRVGLILDSLEEPEFRAEVGDLMEHDLDDLSENFKGIPSEVGGIGILDNGKVHLCPIESKLIRMLKNSKIHHSDSYILGDPNSLYELPRWAQKLPHIFEFHFHANNYDCSNIARPSFEIQKTRPGMRGFLSGDLGALINGIHQNGDGHEILFTKMKGHDFNVIYYGGRLDENGEAKVVVLNLGTYPYD